MAAWESLVLKFPTEYDIRLSRRLMVWLLTSELPARARVTRASGFSIHSICSRLVGIPMKIGQLTIERRSCRLLACKPGVVAATDKISGSQGGGVSNT